MNAREIILELIKALPDPETARLALAGHSYDEITKAAMSKQSAIDFVRSLERE